MKNLLLVVGLLFPVLANAADGDTYIMFGGLTGMGEKTYAYQVGFDRNFSEHFSVGATYYNEGHLPSDHRDGLALQGWYGLKLSRDLALKLGVGPYVSMDGNYTGTTETNDKGFGILSSVALKWYPSSSSWYLRAQYNNVLLVNGYSTNALLLGVGTDYEKRKGDLGTDTEFGLWTGISRVTNANSSNGLAFQIEGKRPINDYLAYSVAYLNEGSNRQGVLGQLWLEGHSEKWNYGGGIGPYLAFDSAQSGPNLMAAGSLRLTRNITKSTQVGFTYTRVISTYNRDSDIYMFGGSMKF